MHMLTFLSGANALSYVIAGVFFLRFWKRTADQLFIYFALAFWLLAANQIVASWLGVADERLAYVYTLRVLGFGLLAWGIVRKNLRAR